MNDRPGKRTLTSTLPSAPRREAPELAIGKTSAAGTLHPAPPKRVAEGPEATPAKHAEPNAVIKIVAYAGGKPIGQPWGAKARWEGPLPQRYTGTRGPAGWTWDSPDAKSVRIGSDLHGQGGKTVEAWAGATADRIVIYATALDAVTDAKDAAPDSHAPGHATDARAAGDGSSSAAPAVRGNDQAGWNANRRHRDHGAVGAPTDADEHGVAPRDESSHDGDDLDGDLGPVDADERLDDDIERHLVELSAELERQIAEDAEHWASATPDGEHHGRTGDDTRIGGTGPGGERARPDGDGDGSEDGGRGGTQDGSRDGAEHGAPDGMYGGEGKLGDAGIPSGSGIIGILGVPAALRGAVEVALIAADGNITGAGSGLFKKGLGKITSAVAARKMIASQARVTAAKETKAALKQIATNPKTAAAWKAASKEAKAAVTRRMYWEMQRRYFDAYLAAAKQAKRDATAALKRSAKDVAARQRLGAAEMAEEAATVKPVAGRLPVNHELAGKQFPVDQLPAKYRSKGLRFTKEGYPDFSPHAKQLPNGNNHVEIQLTGSRAADAAAATRKAGLTRDVEDYIWHHAEDGKTMYLVPKELHQAVRHTGGTSSYRHARGVGRYAQ
ncbi:MAG TPA: HNH endonuclease [Kofleriaceae bacterium]|nr:HNH endonuclease [Kofleriaceae bacterium]